MRYRADITAGALMIPERRVVADMLISGINRQEWHVAIFERNVLQARRTETARRLARLIRSRLARMDGELWRLVRDGASDTATHAVLAAAVKHSRLLGDFLDLVVREQYRIFARALSNPLWDQFLDDCRGRDPDMPVWAESTRIRLRSSVFQILAQTGCIDNTRAKTLQTVHLASQVTDYLAKDNESYVLRCIQVTA